MKRGNLHIVSIVMALMCVALLCSCAYKRYYRDGVEYEASNMYNLAFDRYLAALEEKETAEARVALNRVAVHYVSQLQDGIETDYNTGNDDDLVAKYQKLATVVKSADKHNVAVTISERTQGQYDEAKNRYITNHYERGQQLLEGENFTASYKEFALVSAVDATYDDVKRLMLICKCEPLYRDAVANMKADKYRTAYGRFESLLKLDANYKDAVLLQKQALEKAILTVAFSNFGMVNSGCQRMADKIKRDTKARVTAANNKFLKVVELDQTKNLLQEQKLAMANGLDLATNIIPVRAHLVCNITKLQHTYSKLKRTEQKGYVQETTKDGNIILHKVTYNEYRQSLTSNVTMSYSLISVETGVTLLSDVLSFSNTDEVHYVIYNGSYSGTLMPGYWESYSHSDKDVVKSDYLSISTLKSLQKARQTLQSTTDIEDEFAAYITATLYKKLINYNPEK